MVWTQPDWYAGTATAQPGGDGAGSALTPCVGRSSSITRSVLRSTLLITSSIWIECARWCTKNTSMSRLTKSSTSAKLTASRG